VSALAGRAVVVTRARAQADALCALLEARGARPVVFPAIAIEPVDGAPVALAVAGLGAYDWIAFTSANAVTAFFAAMRAADRPALPAGLRVAAVGEPTARALEREGIGAVVMPGRFLGVELASAMGPLAGQRVLLPCSHIARDATRAALRDAGADVDAVVVHRTVTARPTPEELRALDRPVDAVTFTSPSTVRGFLEAGGPAARRLAGRAAVACIGPTTTAAARAAGLTVAVEPARHTADALVEALDTFFAPAAPAPAGTRP
jgi:uroporphyrinogen-III synthase